MFQESEFDVQQATYSGGDSDKDNRLFIIPAAYYVHPINELWRLGLSLNVPSGIGYDYGRSWSGRYLSEESELAFVAASSVRFHSVPSMPRPRPGTAGASSPCPLIASSALVPVLNCPVSVLSVTPI